MLLCICKIINYITSHSHTSIRHLTSIMINSSWTNHVSRSTYNWASNCTLISIITNGSWLNIIDWVIKKLPSIKMNTCHWYASVWHWTAIRVHSSTTMHVISWAMDRTKGRTFCSCCWSTKIRHLTSIMIHSSWTNHITSSTCWWTCCGTCISIITNGS